MVAEQVGEVLSDDHQRSPSLVDVLSKLAAYWVLCECGVEIGKAGIDGWAKKGLRLGNEIDSLNDKIQRTKSPSRKAAKQDELEKLRAQSDAIDKEWGEAREETDAYREMFADACEFCRKKCIIGANEFFNAALIDFDPTRLQPHQGPSEDRMREMVSLLDNVHSAMWKTQRWANLRKPTMRSARRVTPEKRNSFIVRSLNHIETVSGSFGQDNPSKGLNAGVKPRSANLTIDDKPFLGLVFQHDSTVKRIGYEGNFPIQLAPQRLKLLKFVHEAGKVGRTQSEIVPNIILDKNTLTSEKNRIKQDLKTIDIDLGPRGQYVVRCTRIAKKKSL